ncbi:MAG TPA: PIN domain-containing protein [Solirubrobacteraceae bacterium]|nr:PIN domain-containing protein [Solirubrobacteraceae bacterium]
MSEAPPFGGSVLIADTSAWARASHRLVRQIWASAVRNRQIATCSIVTLELMYSARDSRELATLEAEQALLREIPLSASAQRAAMAALRDLAKGGAGRHRVPIADALIAAAAQDGAVDVLHYDRHYDRLSEVLNFRSVWIAPPGSLEDSG